LGHYQSPAAGDAKSDSQLDGYFSGQAQSIKYDLYNQAGVKTINEGMAWSPILIMTRIYRDTPPTIFTALMCR